MRLHLSHTFPPGFKSSIDLLFHSSCVLLHLDGWTALWSDINFPCAICRMIRGRRFLQIAFALRQGGEASERWGGRWGGTGGWVDGGCGGTEVSIGKNGKLQIVRKLHRGPSGKSFGREVVNRATTFSSSSSSSCSSSAV